MSARSSRRTHPVLVCRYKGDPRRFFGKFKDPEKGVWKKIPGGPFSPSVDTPEKALACAERWYVAEFVEIDRPQRIVSWEDACDAFLEEVRNRVRGSDATRDEARQKALALRSSRVLRSKPLGQHDEVLALTWFREFAHEVVTRPNVAAGPRDPRTVRNYVKILREVYRLARRHGALAPATPEPANGSELVQELRAMMAAKPQREFMMEENLIATVLASEQVSEFRRVWLATLIYTGMRPGEAHGLKLEDLQVLGRVRTFRVQRQYKLSRAKIPPKFGPLKTKNSYRVLPLHPDLWRRLEPWIASGWSRYVGRDPNPEDVLFPDPQGNPFREDRADDFRDILAGLELPTTFRGIPLIPYAVRHTFSTVARRVGIPAEDRDYFMGHGAKSVRAGSYDVNDVRHRYVQIRKLPTFTAEGLREHELRMNALDDIDEAELAPTG